MRIALAVMILLTLLLPLVGAAEVYRVVDEPGLEPGVPQVGEDDDVAKGLADILEAWLEIEGGDVELYLAVDSEYDPINLPLEWPYDIRYLAYALLDGGGRLYNLSMEIAAGNNGLVVGICRVSVDGSSTEVFGRVESQDRESGGTIVKLGCSFSGVSFSKPGTQNQVFRVVTTVISASIDEQVALTDIAILSPSDDTQSQPSVGAPPETTEDDQLDEEPGDEGSFPILIVVAVVLLILVGAGYYLIRIRGGP